MLMGQKLKTETIARYYDVTINQLLTTVLYFYQVISLKQNGLKCH
jgi:hypothetical protein